MKTFASPGKCTDSGFKFLSLFLFDKNTLTTINLIMNFFGVALEGKRGQSSTKIGLIGTSNSSKISMTFDSRSLPATLAGIPEIFRHPLLEYCPLSRVFQTARIYVSSDLHINLEFRKV